MILTTVRKVGWKVYLQMRKGKYIYLVELKWCQEIMTRGVEQRLSIQKSLRELLAKPLA